MSRVKLSEYSAKKILNKFYLACDFKSLSYDASQESLDDLKSHLSNSKTYVVKVDQGEKKRFKRGLIGVNISSTEVISKIEDLTKQGFSVFIIEEYLEHNANLEQYLSLSREREGIRVLYNPNGGINVEDSKDSLITKIISYNDVGTNHLSAPRHDGLSLHDLPIAVSSQFLESLLNYFESEYIAFLEINPFVEQDGEVHILDMAVEVDSTANFFGVKWTQSDFYKPVTTLLEEEIFVKNLDEDSPSSLKLKVLNPNGSIFMLLSGGGASITLADESYNLGFQNEIVNYGECSGNPTEEETYLYTKQLISLIQKSKAEKKVLIIAGGVANFTDVYKTFSGIIRALNENSEVLQKANLKVFVRRGGPNQKKGLEFMKQTLEEIGILGGVYGPELVLTDIVGMAIKSI